MYVIQAMAFWYSNVDMNSGDPNTVPWNTGNIQNQEFLDSGIEIYLTTNLMPFKIQPIWHPDYFGSFVQYLDPHFT